MRLAIDDEVPTPSERTPFRVQLSLKKHQKGTMVEARVNGVRFARKYLVGLTDATAKLVVGCHNMHCEFDDLTVQGAVRQKPARPQGPANAPDAP